MPRNSSGSYSLPENPFVPSTPISSTAVNSDFDDIATALTDSLSRTGDGGMLDVLQLTSSGFNYQGDSNTGMSRSNADTQVITCGGTDVVEVTTTGANITGTLDATTLKQGGNAILPVGLGPLPWSGETAPALWVLANGQALLRASYPALWTFAAAQIALGNTLYTNGNGSTTFTVPNMNGRVPAGKDNGAGLLTATTMTPDGNTTGATGGAQTENLTIANINSFTPTVASATVDLSGGNVPLPLQGDLGHTGGTPTAKVSQGNNQTAATTLNVTPTGTLNATVTMNALGSGTAHVNVQPTIIVNYIIFAGV